MFWTLYSVSPLKGEWRWTIQNQSPKHHPPTRSSSIMVHLSSWQSTSLVAQDEIFGDILDTFLFTPHIQSNCWLCLQNISIAWPLLTMSTTIILTQAAIIFSLDYQISLPTGLLAPGPSPFNWAKPKFLQAAHENLKSLPISLVPVSSSSCSSLCSGHTGLHAVLKHFRDAPAWGLCMCWALCPQWPSRQPLSFLQVYLMSFSLCPHVHHCRETLSEEPV